MQLLGLDSIVPGLLLVGDGATSEPTSVVVVADAASQAGAAAVMLTNERRRVRKKGLTGGLFSTLAGISRWEEEDGVEMVKNVSRSMSRYEV